MVLNVVDLFAGVGGFRLGLEMSDKEFFNTVWMNQWEPSKKEQDAFNCYKERFPLGEHSNEDIGEVNTNNIKKLDPNLIVGGFPCFAKGTLITTLKGLKNIECIKEGDYVLTHKKRFRRVNKVMIKEKKGLYKLRVKGSQDLKVTEEHPIYVKEVKRQEEYNGKKYEEFTNPKWVEVRNLDVNKHYIGIAENKKVYKKHGISDRELWLMGRYLANGYCRNNIVNRKTKERRNTVVFRVKEDDMDEVQKRIEGKYYKRYYEDEDEGRYVLYIKSKRLVDLCEKMGNYKRDRNITKELLLMSRSDLKIFFKGYFSWEKPNKKGEYTLKIRNKKHAYGLGILIKKAFNIPYEIKKLEEKWEISWRITFKKDDTEGIRYRDKMMWTEIKDITYDKEFNGKVYNFEVDEDNSYVADNIVVHNCQDYSVARSSKGKQGIEGKKGVLFWEIIRFVKDINPDYLLLENVDSLLITPSEQRGRDFAVMLSAFDNLGYNVEWRVLTPSDYGGGQRRKRVFIYVVRRDKKYAKNMNKMHIYDLLYKSGFFAPKFPVMKSLFKLNIKGIELYKDIVEVSNKFEIDIKNTGAMIDGNIYTIKTRPKKEEYIPLKDNLEKDVDSQYYLNNEEDKKFEYLRGRKEIERETKEGFQYTYKEGKMSDIDELHLPSRTILTSEGGVSRTTHVVKDDKGKRFLTPVECERLNNFPDGWTKGMSNRMRYFCMGNALDVNLVKKMGDRLKEIDDKE